MNWTSYRPKWKRWKKEVAKLQERIGQPEFYAAPFDETQPVLDRLSNAQQALEQATNRWVELEDTQSS